MREGAQGARADAPGGRNPAARGSLLRSLLPAAAILVLMGGLASYHGEAARLGERARLLERGATARALRSRLVGTPLGELRVTAPRGRARGVGGEGPGLRALWFVDPRSCVRCLSDLSGWRSLAGGTSVEGALILTGIDGGRAARAARQLNAESDVLWDRDGRAMRAVAGEEAPPYLLLLLDPEGEILAAEVGERRTGCGPDVFRRLAAVADAVAEAGPGLATAAAEPGPEPGRTDGGPGSPGPAPR